ncbi:MAG: hypothetical protein KF856_19210 [Cyclobacteriaceae bacterium]|nr:hypothetical protein [Cyclobacteriaceae bacterium]
MKNWFNEQVNYMKIFNLIFTLILVTSCTKPNSQTEIVNSVQSPTDSLNSVEESISSEQLSNERTDTDKISLDVFNLTKFPFVTNRNYELTLSPDGKFTLLNESENSGTWRLSENVIQLFIDEDTVSFTVELFTEDELVMATPQESGGKLFGEIDNDWMYPISFSRIVFSPPYSEEQISGGWQAREGGCSFQPGGAFSFGAADCNVTGVWEFDGEYIAIELTQKECGWSDPFDTRLKVTKLSQKVMFVENSKGETERFWR